MYKLSYVIRVSAPDLDELKRRCDEVKDFYDDLNVKLVRPAGDMLGLHSEFLPASKRYINDYVQYVKSDFLAGLGFGATQQLGETTGIYMGYSVDTGRNVYLQPSLASQGVKGTVTNALASAFVGSLGGGKSFCNNLLVYYAVLFGGQAVILDPKAERGNWKETLPEIAHEINIVNLTSDKDNAGLLDPFVIMKNVKDAESLAIDILTFLTGISSRDGEKFPVLRKAVRSVTQSEKGGLLHVIEELRKEDTPVSRNIADHIDSFTDYDFAHLLFSDGTVENAISLDNQLNIIQVADLVLPDKDRRMEHRIARAVSAGGISGGVAGAVAGSAVAGKRAERKNTASKENRGNTTSSMGQRAGSKVGAVLDTKNKVKDKANAVKENIKDMPTQTAYAVYSAKEKAKSSVSDFKRGMVQEQKSRQTGRLEKQEQHRQNIADKRMELQKAQEARQAQRKADGSATTGATRPHERPATASTIPKPSTEKTQEIKRPATATTSKASEPVKTNVIKERPLSSGASDRKASQPIQPAHRQNVEKVVSQETHQNYKAERTTKAQTFEQSKRTTEHTEKNRNLVMKKGQKKK